jgi:FtsP/CotA-like multicopper oxidase with cupredoxin domain
MRKLQKTLSAAAIFAVAGGAPAMADVYDIKVERVTIDSGDFKRTGVGFNGGSPGPVLRFTEGEQVTLNVTNALTESTSIHWHGLILPYQQDGVPTISFDGIEPGETFTYSFPIIQSGTYWYHSHSNLQEPEGAFGAIVITPKGGERVQSDREHVLVLNDAHPHTSHRILRNLKMMPDYYNRKQRTAGDFIEDVKKLGLEATLSDRADWGQMRMMPTDIEDLQGFTPLINGKGPEQNWTGLFKPGEKVRLRFVNASAMTYFDVRIPGLKFTVVQADGNDVEPVEVDEFRIGVAETYDVIVQPDEDKAYTIFAESMGRSAFARGTLATEDGMAGFVPELRAAPLLTMADMGMSHGGMDHAAMGHDAPAAVPVDHAAMGHGAMNHGKMADAKPDSFYAPGSGLEPVAANGGKVLSYNDLRAANPLYEDREATREIELRLTGNMERYMWSINGVKYGDAEPVRLKYGERVRFKFVNETMMTHPMHLHGMWTILDVGAGQWNPIKHTVSVPPGSTVYTETEVDAPGQWAFHCHLAYHAASGMFRKIVVEGGPDTADKPGRG